MELFYLRLFQVLGFVPVSLETFTNSKTITTSYPRLKKLFAFARIKYFPTLFFTCFSLLLFATFIHNISSCSTTEILNILKSRGTYFFVLFIKSVSHMCCATFIKMDMALERNKLFNFYKDFCLLLSKLGSSKKTKNRYYFRFKIEFATFLAIITYWSVEMYFTVSRISPSREVIFLRVGPVVLGYYHSAFAFLQVFLLIWYLEILKRIRAMVKNQLKTTNPMPEFHRPGDDISSDKKRPQLQRYFRDNDPELNSLSRKWDYNEIIDVYNSVREQVVEFGRLFGTWVALDIGHSVLRIIFSGYFIASIMSRKQPMFSQIVQNFLTMVVYSYLLYMVARRGSELESESRDMLMELGKLDNLKNLNNCKTCRLQNMEAIQIKTKFMTLNLGIITPILPTITTNLLVLIQFHSTDKGNCSTATKST
ncbi:uncharacterized protein LOC118435780 [Folsomia candida]|uniref:uncharacterized protein LOC118435780 n=1 Tax=Folsomia candida TaxID=158441 RepID=UPI001604C36A|nr:uncharacterized protein LOC118435780 [Folsomia candida]